ncbi:MAG: oligoendopeptidase F [Synergistaceae bacterium]|jgi:oligoendopeptidase F|nr:oligoendopeptidase F [Synergistaceae bacterium]
MTHFSNFVFKVVGADAAARTGGGKVPERGDIAEKYKWNLEDIYPSVQAWEEAFAALSPRIDALASFQGKASSSADALLAFLREEEALSKELGRLYVYANMKSHEDLRVTRYQELTDKAENLSMRHSAVTSFFRPEILSMPDGGLEKFISEKEELKLYEFYFSEMLREKEHVLGHREEELLAQTHEIGGVAQNAFTMLTDADMKFPTITDENGQDVELTEERYYKLSRGKDRNVRKAAFEGIHNTYGAYRNAIGTLYAGSVKGDIFYSKARKYADSLDAALFPDNVPETVYDNVVRTAGAHVSLQHECLALRKRALGLDELHMYDLNVPLSEEPMNDVPYEDALEMVAEALAPLGPDYVADLKRGFSERWIDVYENQGKKKGAYSWGSYGTRPYVLLNYNGTLRDVFTIAHEMGHSLHSWYAHGAQPQIYADYTILLAEVASTTNEALLLEYLLRKSAAKPEPERTAERKWLLTYYFDMVRTTFFRQSMFAEYERETHRRAEGGEALTPEWLCDLWGKLCAKYHGPAMTIDEPIRMEWARIPHFYTAFYVYKYVTGFTAAGAFSKAILNEDRDSLGALARERYLTFLKSGSRDFSLEILKNAGVDLRTPKPFEQAMTTFREKLNEAKSLF